MSDHPKTTLNADLKPRAKAAEIKALMDDIALYVATATDQATEIERMREALIAIKGWVDAYPVEVFPPVDLDAVRATLGEPLYTKLHAEWARHILSGIRRYVEAGLS